MKLDTKSLSENDLKSIRFMLSQSPHDPPQLEDIWQLMDNAWDNIGCNNKDSDLDKINKFYAHPVWILNGMFIEQDELSMQHRSAISDWIVNNNFEHVLDFGGGFGTLAQLIAKNDPNISIDIYEPYPSEYALLRVAEYSNIHFINAIHRKYDCLVSTDVLEHVPDPLELFSEMIENVKIDGYIIIANNFYPVIKCHLPSTFHLRYTFRIFTYIMGLRRIGPCYSSHATIYQKKKDTTSNCKWVSRYERISTLLYPILNYMHINIYRRLKIVAIGENNDI